MSKRAIEKAYVAYPLDATNRYDIRLNANRVGYQQGYEQAEKDTIERAIKFIETLTHPDDVSIRKTLIKAFIRHMEED